MISYRFIGNLRVNVLGGYLDSMEQDKTFLGNRTNRKIVDEAGGSDGYRTAGKYVVQHHRPGLYRSYSGRGQHGADRRVCMPLILIIAAFAALVGSGGSPRASIYMGKGEHDTAEKNPDRLSESSDHRFHYSDRDLADLERKICYSCLVPVKIRFLMRRHI